jgi:hypothetical protein
MDGFERDTNTEKNLAVLNFRNTVPRGLCSEDVTFITVSYPSAGEKNVPAPVPPGNSCRDSAQKKNNRVDYPGRSVLYSRQFRPFNRIISPESKKLPSGES